MIPTVLCGLARLLLKLRYRIRFTGMEAVAKKGKQGILFLPNHPALIDPVILTSRLFPVFSPRALADQAQIDRPIVHWATLPFRLILMRDVARLGAAAGRGEAERALAEVAAALNRGENVLFYPAGHLKHSRYEELGANSGVETLLKACPRARIVLIRTSGLWGSSFSFGQGRVPYVPRSLAKGALSLLASGIFFAPRRPVTVAMAEPDDFPRTSDRNVINRYLERFYNQDATANTYVPYTLWEKGGIRTLPEPVLERHASDLAAVPAATRGIVFAHLRRETGVADIREDMMLSRDLGLDSLAMVSLSVWIESEFGFPVADNAANLATVADVLLAAAGTIAAGGLQELRPIPASWFRSNPEPVSIPEGETLTSVFLRQARRFPNRAVVADQNSGVKTYRDLITGILALQPVIQKLPGDTIGIMLPAAAASAIVYLAAVFAGKIPVMVNWTVGTRNMTGPLDRLAVRNVFTSGVLVQRLEAQGTDFGSLKDRFIFLEEAGRRISLPAKLAAWGQSRFNWSALRKAQVRDTAVVLFTSGSESLPKAVPLSHANFLANLRDVVKILRFNRNDRMIGMLPPFHSFGILGTMLFPLCGALAVVYHPNPTEGGMLARLIAAYRATVLVGTPTFLGGVVRAATDEQLETLRLVVSGAEKCPESLFQTIAQRWPRMRVLEGYGITECSPVVSVNREETIRPGTIGQVLPSVEYAIQDVASGRRAPVGMPGMLLVRGPSIFNGYLNYDGPTPFVAFEGKIWYRTGDLVAEDPSGVITFAGRLKRFVKLGGEMISLPAIEEVLARSYVKESDEKPVLAVEAAPEALNPELVLFTILDLEREEVNRKLREGGLSAIYHIRKIVKLPEIPVLGTGKTDYRALRERLEKGAEGG